MAVLTRFSSITPRYRCPQPQAIEWLAHAHARAEGDSGLARRYGEIIRRFGAKETDLAARFHELEDFTHLDWEEMRVFGRVPAIEERMKIYSECVGERMEELFSEDTEAPEHLFHVTCTGYESPSAAQKLVARRKWKTQVTHLYHMGCYAAIPALRLARGLASGEIVHTELCTLHLDPREHSPEQLVTQSLFADGMIRYAFTSEPAPGLEVYTVHERLVPGTESAMTWNLGSSALRMTLSREIPKLLGTELEKFCHELHPEFPDLKREAVFAVHPGGPKILDQVEEALGLAPEQMKWSREVFRERGNMSSATLPYIWKSIWEDPSVPHGKWIVSLAFGPGLTIAGALLRKVER